MNETNFLDDGELYDLIVEVVGDEASLEFCTLIDIYLDGNGTDASMRANGTDWTTIRPLIAEMEEKAQEET